MLRYIVLCALLYLDLCRVLLRHIALRFIALHCIALYDIVLYYAVKSHFKAPILTPPDIRPSPLIFMFLIDMVRQSRVGRSAKKKAKK